ncbi:MAG: Transcriptional regulator [uncultured Thiotrichaceae bacterium]|uniref:Transcriptional regulator n=1 Tax=uncultured Thiotrichaceae bacterium TaxID=298394 RepID=A0A6S6U3W7_9GAMM|nr:MAG: Transcriptional regulator [uncultured Thiotrichaceae bacterium]
MPIYEYECTNCEHQMEAIQKFSDKPLKLCPACAENTLEKRVSAPSFRLSGTGWYETDFKPNKKKVASKKEASNNANSCSTDGDFNVA